MHCFLLAGEHQPVQPPGLENRQKVGRPRMVCVESNSSLDNCCIKAVSRNGCLFCLKRCFSASRLSKCGPLSSCVQNIGWISYLVASWLYENMPFTANEFTRQSRSNVRQRTHNYAPQQLADSTALAVFACLLVLQKVCHSLAAVAPITTLLMLNKHCLLESAFLSHGLCVCAGGPSVSTGRLCNIMDTGWLQVCMYRQRTRSLTDTLQPVDLLLISLHEAASKHKPKIGGRFRVYIEDRQTC